MGRASPLAPYSPNDRRGLPRGAEETAHVDRHRHSAGSPVAAVTPSDRQVASWGRPSAPAAGMSEIFWRSSSSPASAPFRHSHTTSEVSYSTPRCSHEVLRHGSSGVRHWALSSSSDPGQMADAEGDPCLGDRIDPESFGLLEPAPRVRQNAADPGGCR